MDNSLTVVSHQPNESGVPLVDDLGEGRRTRAHQHLSDAVVERLDAVVGHTKESLGSALLRLLVRKVPNCILERELLSRSRANLGQDANLEAAHGEEQLWVIPRIDRNECVFPLDGGEGPRQTLLDVPEYGPAEIDIVLDEAHPAVARPAALVVVPDDIVVRRIGVRREVTLDEVASFVRSEPEQDVQTIDVSRVETNGMPCLSGRITVLQEVVGLLRRSGHLARSLQAEDEKIEDETVVLEDEG